MEEANTQRRYPPRNEHIIERVIRVVLGVAILSLAYFGPQTPWAFLGVIPLITGLLGFCPLYKVIGFSTCSGENCEA